MICLSIAGLTVGIDNRFDYISELAKDYLIDEKPLFVVSVSREDILKEKESSGTNHTDGYYESIISYRKIAEILPEYDAFLFHGSVISYKDNAYVITANSGVGKTTHTRLWLSEFKDEAHVLNGDKPIIRIMDGVAYACGTPWQGKENYGCNEILALSGIAFLERGEGNCALDISPTDAVTRFMSQIYLPKSNLSVLAKTMRLADKVIRVKIDGKEQHKQGNDDLYVRRISRHTVALDRKTARACRRKRRRDCVEQRHTATKQKDKFRQRHSAVDKV